MLAEQPLSARQRVQQFAMNAAKAAIAHHDDAVTRRRHRHHVRHQSKMARPPERLDDAADDGRHYEVPPLDEIQGQEEGDGGPQDDEEALRYDEEPAPVHLVGHDAAQEGHEHHGPGKGGDDHPHQEGRAGELPHHPSPQEDPHHAPRVGGEAP